MSDRPNLQFCFTGWPRTMILTTLASLLFCIATLGAEPPQTIAPQLFRQQTLRNRTAPKPNDSNQASTVTFYAMGDVPYAPEEDLLLPKQIANLPTDGHFVIHVGDIKNGATPCDEAIYTKVASMLGKSKLPIFIIPGDNEWNDCENPAQGWKYWLKHFNNFDTKWKYDFVVNRQKVRNENFTFNLDGVLFIGINLVGGRVHDPAEWKTRHTQNILWIKSTLQANHKNFHAIVLFGHAHPMINHNDFFTPLLPIVKTTNVPLLYLHGDGHKWIKDKPLGTDLITRVQVDQGGIAPPVKVTVTRNPNEPFIFNRRLPKTP
ncbi:MAG: hypothetical protein HOF72_05520 [Planctomycetaceae bacterium]|nr:hypothetical protein [Planctomycetaceae bacterium]